MSRAEQKAFRKEVVALAAQGVDPKAIAKRFGRSRCAIYGILWREKNVTQGQPFRRPRAFTRNYSVWVEAEMEQRIEALRFNGQNTAQLLRDIIAAGLDDLEQDNA